MRKVILSIAVSLDGFIEGPNGEVDWMTFDEETEKKHLAIWWLRVDFNLLYELKFN